MSKVSYHRARRGDLKGALLKIQTCQLQGREYSMKQIAEEYHIRSLRPPFLPDMRNIEVTDNYVAELQKRISADINRRNNHAKKRLPDDSKRDNEDDIMTLVAKIKQLGAVEVIVKF